MAQNRLLWMLALPVVLVLFVWLDPFGSPSGLGPAADKEVADIALTGPVVDRADILTADQEKILTRKLLGFQRTTDHQMVVVTVSTLQSAPIERFTDALGNNWRIGRKGHDDGIVLLVAPNQGQVRLAVGDGLKSELPDALCKSIIERDLIPRFRTGDDYAAIIAGVDAVVRRLD